MTQSPFAVFVSQGLEEGGGHLVQVDEGHLFAGCYSFHSCREVAVGVAYGLIVAFKSAAGSGGTEDDVATLGPHLIYEDLELVSIVVPSTVAGLVFLLIIMSKLTDYVIAFTQGAQYLIQAMSAKEGTGSERSEE